MGEGAFLDPACRRAECGHVPSARSWIIITRNGRIRVWATSSSRRRPHSADGAHYAAVSGSAACSSSIAARAA
jgi:hypothetical protein